MLAYAEEKTYMADKTNMGKKDKKTKKIGDTDMKEIKKYNDKLINLGDNILKDYTRVLTRTYNMRGTKLFEVLDLILQVDPKPNPKLNGKIFGPNGMFEEFRGFINYMKYLIVMEADFKKNEKGNLDYIRNKIMTWQKCDDTAPRFCPICSRKDCWMTIKNKYTQDFV